MAIVWRPSWEVVTIDYHGIKIRVLKDRVTRLYACPLCFRPPQEGTFFFDIPSLVEHIMSHTK